MDQETSTPDGVSESAVRAAHDVRVVYSRLRRRMRETYDPGDLTPSQTSVLSRLDKDGEASVSRGRRGSPGCGGRRGTGRLPRAGC